MSRGLAVRHLRGSGCGRFRTSAVTSADRASPVRSERTVSARSMAAAVDVRAQSGGGFDEAGERAATSNRRSRSAPQKLLSADESGSGDWAGAWGSARCDGRPVRGSLISPCKSRGYPPRVRSPGMAGATSASETAYLLSCATLSPTTHRHSITIAGTDNRNLRNTSRPHSSCLSGISTNRICKIEPQRGGLPGHVHNNTNVIVSTTAPTVDSTNSPRGTRHPTLVLKHYNEGLSKGPTLTCVDSDSRLHPSHVDVDRIPIGTYP